MRGFFDEEGHPRIEVSLFGSRAEATIEVLIDTGFDGALCVPIPLAIPLGLELYGDHNYELADGTIKQELTYRAIIHLGEETHRAEIVLTESEEALIGSELLEGYILEIDYGNRTVEIRKSPANNET